MKKGKLKAKNYALRIDPALVEPLQALKKANRRSLNAEINAALEVWVGRSAAKLTKTPKKSKGEAAVTEQPSKAESKPAAEAAKKQEPAVAAVAGSDPETNGHSG